VRVSCNGVRFDEDLLFTHRGLSGPAILQISSFWQPGAQIELNLAPEVGGLAERLLETKPGNRQSIGNVLATLLPRRLADGWLIALGIDAQTRMADVS
jgi:predicted flavoprotein YhiN